MNINFCANMVGFAETVTYAWLTKALQNGVDSESLQL